jgi:hypothetical protein
MAFRVWVGNTPIDCETAEAAFEMARRIEADSTTRPERSHCTSDNGSNPAGSRWTERRVSEFFKLIDGNQRKLIDTLLEHSDGRTDEQLMSLLAFDDGRALGGVFAGMYKNAKKVGADPDDLYKKKPVTIGGRKAFEYFLSESFRRLAEAHEGAQR